MAFAKIVIACAVLAVASASVLPLGPAYVAAPLAYKGDYYAPLAYAAAPVAYKAYAPYEQHGYAYHY
uniref:CSON005838 protein n=1 Tax=Culicoides sonorensis TaxID=179676 RepID=A0A336LVP8_CULSO